MTGQKIARYISSWWFTAVFLLAACGSYIYFSSSERPYEEWVNFLFYRPAGLIIYIGLIVNLMSANIRIVYTRLRRKKVNAEYIKDMDIYITIPFSGGNPYGKVSGWIKKRGFSAYSTDDIPIGIKGRFSFLPGTIMRAGLIVLMTALIFSVHLRKVENTIFNEGDERLFSGKVIKLSGIRSDLPEGFLQVGEENTFRLKNISAVLSQSGNAFIITNGFPARIEGMYFRISGFGFSQNLSFRKDGEEFRGKTDLDILPPGKTDTISPAPNILLSFSLQPERTIKKGLITGKQFDLKNLNYRVAIKDNKRIREYEGLTLSPLESKTVEGYAVSLGEDSFFVRIQSVYDPALIWVYTGMFLILVAFLLMFSRFFWYERQICAFIKDGEILVGYSEEYYRKWGIQRFQRWIEELAGLLSEGGSV